MIYLSRAEKFYLVYKGYYWDDARATCRHNDAELASLANVEERDALKMLFRNKKVGPGWWWIGLNDKEIEGEFVWNDGSKEGLTEWNDSEPNDSKGESDCVAITADTLKLFDEPCRTNFYFVCKNT